MTFAEDEKSDEKDWWRGGFFTLSVSEAERSAHAVKQETWQCLALAMWLITIILSRRRVMYAAPLITVPYYNRSNTASLP